MRCVHEASLYKRNCFITLTYSDEYLPKDRVLQPRDFQLFMKRLRKRFPQDKIRYFQCGEYGDLYGRPHYHACLFNFDFEDRKLWSKRNGNDLFTSKILDEVWGLGHGVVGQVTFESAAYVARYVLKKVTGDKAADHYQGRQPEYVTMSRGGRGDGLGGIGKRWLEKWMGDVYPSDSVVMRGKAMRPPRFYDGLLEKADPEGLKKIKEARIQKALEGDWYERSLYRLGVKEEVKKAQIRSLSRKLDGEL